MMNGKLKLNHCCRNQVDLNLKYYMKKKMYDDYRCFAKDLKFLAKNLTAFEKASELREKWLVEYKRKSALCEELRLAF